LRTWGKEGFFDVFRGCMRYASTDHGEKEEKGKY
jgi:hypothetical protein